MVEKERVMIPAFSMDKDLQTKRISYLKTIVFTSIIILCFWPSAACIAKESPEERLAKLDSSIEALEKGEKAMRELNGRADLHLKGNLWKASIKLGKDIYDWAVILKPENLKNLASIVMPKSKYQQINLIQDQLTSKALSDTENIIAGGEKAWGYATHKKTHAPTLGPDAAERLVALAQMYKTMEEILHTKDLSRYDSDNKPFKYTSSWWSIPDGKKDKWLQTIMRRVYIIRELSDKISQVSQKELVKLRKERHRVAKLTPKKELPGGVMEKIFVHGNSTISLRLTGVKVLCSKSKVDNHERIITIAAAAGGSKVDLEATLKAVHTYSAAYLNADASFHKKNSAGNRSHTWDRIFNISSKQRGTTLIRKINKSYSLEGLVEIGVLLEADSNDSVVYLELRFAPWEERKDLQYVYCD